MTDLSAHTSAGFQQRLKRITDHLYPPSFTASTELAQTIAYNQSKGQIESKLFANGCLSITLNRPEALNALSMDMLVTMNALLKKAQSDAAVAFIVLQSDHPKSFCAGGDVKRFARETVEYNSVWYHHLYNLIRRIHRYRKPIVALQNGFTMGGGVGISVYATFRVVAPGFVWAMPEVGIGLFPDVGGSYFLNYIIGPSPAVGHYLALTGVSIKAADALFVGAATHFTHRIDQVKEALTKSDSMTALTAEDTRQRLRSILDGFAAAPDAKSSIRELLPLIERCFSPIVGNDSNAAANRNGVRSVEDIVASLDKQRSQWASRTAALIRSKSPTSLKVTFELLRRGLSQPQFTIEDSLRLEYRLLRKMLLSCDFQTGVRAVLIDKQKQPVTNWQPPTLEAVTDPMVDSLFDVNRTLHFD